MNIKQSIYLLIVMITMPLIGCSPSLMSSNEPANRQYMMLDSKQENRGKYLAYEHHVSVDIAQDKIQQTYQTLIDSCSTDKKHQCTILHASIDTGKHYLSEIKLRIKPEGVNAIVNLAASSGEIAKQSTDVEDLGDAFVDIEKRLDRLKQYQSSLQALKDKPDNNIDALVKVASELATVQTDLEYAQGKKDKLLLQVQTDIVNISLFSQSSLSFWQPINESTDDFANNLSTGISQTITAIAFLIPWTVIIIFVVYIIRFIWRKLKPLSPRN